MSARTATMRSLEPAKEFCAGWRTATRTNVPSAASRSTMRRPRNPVPPKTVNTAMAPRQLKRPQSCNALLMRHGLPLHGWFYGYALAMGRAHGRDNVAHVRLSVSTRVLGIPGCDCASHFAHWWIHDGRGVGGHKTPALSYRRWRPLT